MSGPASSGGDLTPIPDAASACFFSGLREGVLRIQVCDDCGARQLGRLHCDGCGSKKLSWITASGRGVVYSFVVVHNRYHPAFEPPYAAGVVELEEGPCLYTRLEAPALEIGTCMRIDFRPVSEACPSGFVFVSEA